MSVLTPEENVREWWEKTGRQLLHLDLEVGPPLTFTRHESLGPSPVDEDIYGDWPMWPDWGNA